MDVYGEQIRVALLSSPLLNPHETPEAFCIGLLFIFYQQCHYAATYPITMRTKGT